MNDESTIELDDAIPANRRNVPTVDSIVDDLAGEIEQVKTVIAPALNAIEQALASLDESLRENVTYVNYNKRGTLSTRLTIGFTARAKSDLMDFLTAFARHGIRRVHNHAHFDCADSMTRLYDMHFESVRICLQVALAGANCKRVQVGLEPKYEIVCA